MNIKFSPECSSYGKSYPYEICENNYLCRSKVFPTSSNSLKDNNCTYISDVHIIHEELAFKSHCYQFVSYVWLIWAPLMARLIFLFISIRYIKIYSIPLPYNFQTYFGFINSFISTILLLIGGPLYALFGVKFGVYCVTTPFDLTQIPLWHKNMEIYFYWALSLLGIQVLNISIQYTYTGRVVLWRIIREYAWVNIFHQIVTLCATVPMIIGMCYGLWELLFKYIWWGNMSGILFSIYVLLIFISEPLFALWQVRFLQAEFSHSGIDEIETKKDN